MSCDQIDLAPEPRNRDVPEIEPLRWIVSDLEMGKAAENFAVE
jgi:hypothetical protein